MKQSTLEVPALTIGLDVGDRWIYIARLDGAGELQEERIACTREAVVDLFSRVEACRIVLEVGAHSRWLSKLLGELGHEVVVANAGKVRSIYAHNHKTDRNDAAELARLGRFDISLLHPIEHRSDQAQADLSLLHARDSLVKCRTLLLNQVRGCIKATGLRIPSGSAETFPRRAESLVPSHLRGPLTPLLDQLDSMTAAIRQFDRDIEVISKKRYPQAQLVRQIPGVGPISSLAFTLVIFDPTRFRRSRDVAPYLGLVPRKNSSGDRDPQLGITKAGNGFMRRLLVQASQYVLGPHGPDCELKRYGERLVQRGGKAAKKRAIVAVARKLAVLMHHLWTTGEVYRPLLVPDEVN